MSPRKSQRFMSSGLREGSPQIEVTTRSGRKVTPSKRKIEYLNETRTSQTRKQNNISYVEPDDEVEDFDDEVNDENMVVKSKSLFNSNDLAGNVIYGFHTPKKKNAMKALAENTPKTPTDALGKLALNSPRTPKSPKTPKAIYALLAQQKLINTPTETRTQNKQVLKRAAKIAQKLDLESSADEDSDYNEEEESESSEEEMSECSDSSDDDNEMAKTHKDTRKVSPLRVTKLSTSSATYKTVPARISTRGRTKVKQLEDFIPDSDNYFIAASNKKVKTSDHTLDQLKSSRLQNDELFNLLNSIHTSEEHEHRIGEMFQDYMQNFDRWMLEMSKGYNILVYGCGSKQQLLHSFCEEHLADKPLLIVNGFFPSLTIKDILNAIKVQVLDISTNSRNDHEVVDLIALALDNMPNGHVFLVINNIDGVMLRKTKDQHIISRLAKINNLHLIASIDHINAPLMWDQTCVDNFNFLWYDCTTMLPYKNETAFENSVFFQQSGELDLAAMNNVFRSLTNNARNIYMILVKTQIANHKNSNYQGMTFKDLYHKCREGFFVSSDSTLRTQLIEFVDHNMAKIKRSHDGTELVSIPINTQILSIFTQQQNE